MAFGIAILKSLAKNGKRLKVSARALCLIALMTREIHG